MSTRFPWSARNIAWVTISLFVNLILLLDIVECLVPKVNSEISKDFNLLGRRLDGGDEENDDNGNGYDYYDIGNITQKEFNGYAFKFGKCQKIQRFSDKAVEEGLYSSIVTDDIVVFRLCPERRCSAKEEYGCTAGYGEYAMNLNDYLRTMMYYEQDKMQNLCMFCTACQYGNRRSLEEEEEEANNDKVVNDDNDGNSKEQTENAYQSYNKSGYGGNYNNYYNGDDDDEYTDDNADDNSEGYFSTSDACNTYSNVCQQYSSSCYNGEYQDANYLDYLDYFDCVQVEYQNTYYYVKPTCDANNNQITMGVFYDPSCSQYAGNDININKVTGMSFSKDIFTDASDQECVACDYNVSE